MTTKTAAGGWVDLIHSTYKENVPGILANGFRAGRGEGGYGVYFTPAGHSYLERSGSDYVQIHARFKPQKTLLMGSGNSDEGYQKYLEATQENSSRPDLVLSREGYDSAEYHDPWGGVQYIVFDPSRIQIVGPIKTAARRPVATYASPSGGTIWRGLRLPVSDEVSTLAKSYWDESELGEHRTAKIGQIFLDLMSSHPGRHSGPGLGIHWSIRPEMADVAAETSGQRLDWPVVVEATYTAADVVPEGDPLYDESGVWTRSGIEAEVLIRPGARLTVTGLWLAEDFAGSNIFAVDKCPKMNIRGTKYRNVLPSPQQRTAEVRPRATIARITNFTGDALGWNHESAGHLSLRDHAGAPQGGGRDADSTELSVRREVRGQVGGGDLRPRPQWDDHRRGDRGDRAGVRALASIAAPDYLIGPLLRVWAKYAPQTQQQIVAAMRRLRDGRLAPDAKERELKGYYTIPVGGTVSSTPDRLLLIHKGGVWLAVYFVANHNYDAAERVIEAWEASIGVTPRRPESSLTKMADEDQCPYCCGDGLLRGGRYRCQDCMRTFTPPGL